MAKDKVAIKKEEPKRSKKVTKSKPTAKESGLSLERVEESDSEQETKTAKPTAKNVTKAEKKSPKVKKEAAAPPPPPPPPKKPPPSDSDSSDEQETDSDEEMPDAPVVPKKPEIIPAKVNGVKRKPEAEEASSLDDGESSQEEDSDKAAMQMPDTKRLKVSDAKVAEDSDDSSSDQETDSEASENETAANVSKATHKPAATKPTPAKTENSKAPALTTKEATNNSSSDDSSDEQETDSESGSDSGAATATRAPKASEAAAATISQTKAVPVRPYQPPPGYSQASISTSLHSSKSFADKQIWTITAPSNVPLKAIGEVALDALQSGAPVLEHNGVKYILKEEQHDTNQFDNAAMPSKDGYSSIAQPISRKLILQRKIELPNLSAKQADTTTGSKAAANIATPAVSTARPQPKGMKMRYKPPGFGAGDPGLGSDTDEEGAQPKKKQKALQFPKTLGAHGVSEDKPDVETPQVKKSKKTQKSEDVQMANGDSHAVLPEPKLSQTLPQDSIDSKDSLTKEERRRRREEKRARKEAKAKASGKE